MTDVEVDEAIKYYSHVKDEKIQALIRAAQQPRQEWHSMDTAPKDGTKVLLCVYIEALKGYDYGIGAWLEKAGIWSHIIGGKPSHWKPLEPPTGEKS